MADTHPGPSSLTYTPHSLLLVLRPKIWGIERLPRNLRPGQGVGVRVSRGKGETAVERGLVRTGLGVVNRDPTPSFPFTMYSAIAPCPLATPILKKAATYWESWERAFCEVAPGGPESSFGSLGR